MEWIFVLLYIIVSLLVMILYKKIFPYVENPDLDCSDSEQRSEYYSAMTVGVVFWPILLLAFIVKWSIDFVEWLWKKNR